MKTGNCLSKFIKNTVRPSHILFKKSDSPESVSVPSSTQIEIFPFSSCNITSDAPTYELLIDRANIDNTILLSRNPHNWLYATHGTPDGCSRVPSYNSNGLRAPSSQTDRLPRSSHFWTANARDSATQRTARTTSCELCSHTFYARRTELWKSAGCSTEVCLLCLPTSLHLTDNFTWPPENCYLLNPRVYKW